MRPTKIIMSAFGPYAGETALDMNKLGENGIYLITGKTGAGKTTIFDAITFALFGEPSGNSRESSMFRSKYADDETKTFVELTFLYKNQSYTICRTPEYLRKSRRGEGMTKQLAQAELILPDGRVVTKIKEVNQTIYEILGIDRNQFSQIVMIAQGDFLKLLLAPTEDRKKIFRQIFKTDYYNKLQEELKQASAALSREHEGIKNSIEQYSSGILYPEDMETDGELFENLAKIIENDSKIQVESSEILTSLEIEIATQNAIISKINEQIGLKKALAQSKIDEAVAKSALEIAENRIPERDALQAELEKIVAEIARLEDKLGYYDELDRVHDQLKFSQKTEKEMQAELASLYENIAKLVTETTEITAELAEIGDLGGEKERLSADIAKFQTERENLDALLYDARKLKKAQAEYLKLSEKAESFQLDYMQKNRKFLDEQAGILAQSLSPRKKCPVCGSTSHPQVAKLTKNAPTEIEVQEAQKLYEFESRKAVQKSEIASELQGAVSSKLEGTNFIFADANFENSIKKRNTEIEDILYNLEIDVQLHEKKVVKKCDLETKKCENESKSDVFGQKKTTLFAYHSVMQSNISNLMANYERLKADAEFPDKASAMENIATVTAKKISISSSVRDIDEQIKNANSAHASISAQTAVLQSQISVEDCGDINEESEKLELLSTKKSEITQKIAEITTRLTVNATAQSNIIDQQTKLKNAEKRWNFVKSLSNTANGNISGKEKIALETYIQMTYFDRIIRRANIRFRDMTGGQFELRRKIFSENNQKQSGLELDIIDFNNGTFRSVKTLSGGESFKASLALAFGLSDEIQSSVGGIQIDCMFVDEGFGSLDEHSLESAIKVLTELTNSDKLIGIISHVSELKQRIDKQIQVDKNENGHSIIKIV